VRSLQENLTRYAACHRDRRNIATHLVGVPMIVFAVVLALSVAHLPLGPVVTTLAVVASVLASLYYFRLDVVFGLAMAATLVLMCAGASEVTARTTPAVALAWALGLFTLGWALQLWGHRLEGLKPAFFDDAKQLLIGPLFVCAELCFLLGGRPELRKYIEERVGPTVARRSPPTSAA